MYGWRFLFRWLLTGIWCQAGLLLAAPTHFASQVGYAVLCLNHVEPGYFYNYLSQHFGPPYKQSDGAYWFKASGALWSVNVTEVFVSDQLGEYQFIGALSELPPDQLASKLTEGAKVGTRFWKKNAADPYSTYISHTGSVIAFHEGTKSKVYCAARRARMD
jgi:hypothetical protein